MEKNTALTKGTPSGHIQEILGEM